MRNDTTEDRRRAGAERRMQSERRTGAERRDLP
jgi:hypothetical protein